jgi:heat shock protein HslJ
MKISIFILLLSSLIIAGCRSSQKTAITQPTPANKQNTELLETRWELTELMGKTITSSNHSERPINIVLKKEGDKVQGFSGCNTILGKYELKEGNRITFSAMASTLMACPDLETETEFNKMLESVDNYSISGNVLSLSKAKMAPLARFEAVTPK